MGILNRSLNLIFCMKLKLLKRNGSPKEKILDLVLTHPSEPHQGKTGILIADALDT
jgi:hypothetical protein